MRQFRLPAGRLRLVPRKRHERAGLERIIAGARLVTACACLVSANLTWPAPPGYQAAATVFLSAYVAYSAAVFALLRVRPDAALRFGGPMHALDLLWALGVTSLTGGPSSHYSPLLYVFALLAAAYRWGLVETVVTGFVAVALLAAQGAAAGHGVLGASLQVGDLVMRGIWLLLVAFVLGYLAEWNERMRSESAALAQLMQHVRIQHGVNTSIRRLLDEVGKLYAAEDALLVAEEAATGSLYLWRAHEAAPDFTAGERVELGRARSAAYLFPVPAEAEVWGAARRRPERAPVIRALDSSGFRMAASFAIPDEIGGEFPWRSLAALTTVPFEGWRARLLLVNPAVDVTRDRLLRFLQTIVHQAGPAIANIYLVRRLRAKVEEVERARVARELHDGVIQSLLGLEIEMDVVRQKAGQDPSIVAPSLEYLQRLLREQIVAVRKLMARMRPMRVDGRTLAARLASHVARFGSTSGVEASFVSEVSEPDLPPWVCQELVRIVEEALVNVRKHSGAARATVALDAVGGYWRLVVGDNGRGFNFTGRLPLAELEARGIGPAVIMERVNSFGGQMFLESDPGKRSRLEILIQQRKLG